MAAADARIEAATARVELARKQYKPDFTVGLTYALVTGRDDPAGRASPPPDDGRDLFGVGAAINLPIRRERLSAGVREAVERRLAAEESLRAVHAAIGRQLEDAGARLRLAREQWQLFHTVLIVQADESLRSAQFSYETGKADVLDLLDAERTLLQVRLGEARALTDLHIAVVDLERAAAAQLEPHR